MADYTYDPKQLNAQNYPLRKVQAFVRKTTPKFLRPLHDAVDKPILNAVEPLAEEYKQYKPGASNAVPGSAEDAIKRAYQQNLNVAQPPGMRKGGKVKKYAKGGSTPKPYKPSAGDLNEKAGGDQEMENREYQRQKSKRDRPIDHFLPGANYDKEFDTYVARPGMPLGSRMSPNFKIKRNDTDLAAQSVVDYNMTGRKPKQHGGGPGQRKGIDYAKGGSVSSRADGCCTKGKTKGRFV